MRVLIGLFFCGFWKLGVAQFSGGSGDGFASTTLQMSTVSIQAQTDLTLPQTVYKTGDNILVPFSFNNMELVSLEGTKYEIDSSENNFLIPEPLKAGFYFLSIHGELHILRQKIYVEK